MWSLDLKGKNRFYAFSYKIETIIKNLVSFLINHTESLVLLASGLYLHADLYSFVNVYIRVKLGIK